MSLELFQVYQILLFTVHCVHGAVPGLSNATFYSVLCPWRGSRSFKAYVLFTDYLTVSIAVPGLSNLTVYCALCPWSCSRSFKSYFLQCTVSLELCNSGSGPGLVFVSISSNLSDCCN